MLEQTENRANDSSALPFAVFLSHNSREKPVVERIAEKLKREGLEPWLDKWCLTPAGDWQDELAQGLRVSAACAVFVGPAGIGSWENLEYKLATDRMAKDRAFRLFLVLLPGLPEPFDFSTLPPFLSICTWVDLRKGIEDARSFQSLINAIKGLPLGPERPIEPRNDVCPYRGLQTFDEEHTEFFFGRDADIQRLVEKLKTTRFLAVIGPSGSGKSSLVRAGVIPALKKGGLPESDTWKFRVFTPGAHPLTSLAANLLRLYPQEAMSKTLDQMNTDERTLHLAVSLALAEKPATERVVWVIDQFEEVFTLCQDSREREQFIANLLYAASIPAGRSVVALSLRADFYPKCAAYPELSARIAAQQFLVSPMSADGLRQAIEEPAWHTGLEFEQGLVETILDDVENQPGALPLLEHALLELWERRRGLMLTLEAYRESGGVEGAIAKRADTIYASFTAEQQEIARRIMLRLTQPGEGTEDTRRRATMSELITRSDESKEVESVVRTMTDARLLMIDTDEQSNEQITDVSHEALIRSWPKLRKWIEEDRAGLRILRRLTEAAREWQAHKDESLLYRGARLAQAVEWRERNEMALNPLEREFLDASLAAQQLVERRRKRAIIGLAAGLIIAVALAALAVVQWRRADEQAKIALSRQLVAQSLAFMENQPDLGLLLGIEANRVSDSYEARSILLVDMQYREYLEALLHGPTSDVHKVVFSPDGKLLAAASGTKGRDNSVRLWDVASGQLIREALIAHPGTVQCVAFSSDGKILASSDSSGLIILWDVPTLQPIGQPLKGHRGFVPSLAFSPDNKILASGSAPGGYLDMAGEIYLWDVATHERIGQSLRGHTTFVRSLAFSPDGKTLASGNGKAVPLGVEASIILWDVAAQRPLGSPLEGHEDEILSLAFSPDGRVLASGSADRTVRLWDVAARKPLDNFDLLNSDLLEPHKSAVLDLQFTRDGKTLISADAGSDDVGTHILMRTIEVSTVNNKLTLSKSNPTKSAAVYFRQVPSIAFSPETFKWAAGGCRKTGAGGECIEGEVSIWNMSSRLPIGQLVTESFDKSADAVAFSPDGKVLASGGCGKIANVDMDERCQSGEVRLWDAATRQLVGRIAETPHAVTSLAYSPDGKILATGSCANLDPEETAQQCRQGEIRLWNPDTRQLNFQPLVGHNAFVVMLAFSPDGKTLASSDGDKIILWDTGTGQMLGEITTGHQYASYPVFRLAGIAFSPDGKTLASSGCGKIEDRGTSGSAPGKFCIEGEIRFWNVATRQLIAQPLAAHKDQILSIAFSPDGKTLASASGKFDGTIQLWDVATRRPLGRAFTGYATDIKKVFFTPDDETLVSAATMNADNKIYNVFLWDVATRQIIGLPITAHTGNLADLAISPDGLTLASAGSDKPNGQRGSGGSEKRLLLWDIKVESWIRNACRVANRNLTRTEWERYFPNQPYRRTCPNLPAPLG
jgi:WD40 repeat protein/energy-coupling factor transporter ATP-binding protein EcfA2